MALSPEVCRRRSAGCPLLPKLTWPPAPPAPPLPEVASVAPKEKLLLEVLVPAVVLLTTEPPWPPPPPTDCSIRAWEPWPVPALLSPVMTVSLAGVVN